VEEFPAVVLVDADASVGNSEPARSQRSSSLLVEQQMAGWWFGTCFFPYIGNFIIPTDELIFFRGVQNTNQNGYSLLVKQQMVS